MLSTPAEDDSLRLSIKDKIPWTWKFIAGMALHVLVAVEGNGKLFLEKTDAKAALKMLGHSTSSTISPLSLTSVLLFISRELTTCQNFLGLLTSILG